MTINSKKIKKIVKIVFPLLIGLLIIVLMYRKTDFTQLREISSSADMRVIALSLIFGLAGNIFRGLRWEVLINSLNYHPARRSVLYATLGNYAVNFLFPHAGDVWRCATVSRYDRIPIAKTVETFLIDKVLDIVATVVVVLISMLLYIDFFIDYFRNNPQLTGTETNIFSSIWIWLIIGILLTIPLLLFTLFKESKLTKKTINFFQSIWRDIKLISKLEGRRKILIYTLLVWLSFYLYFYICFYAFDFTRGLGPIAGLIVFAMTNIGILVPVQGGIGTWHFMAISSLIILGVDSESALAFAGLVFIIQSLWLILSGLFGVLAIPYVKREKTEIEQ